MIHGCWTLAVIAAFSVGTRRGETASPGAAGAASRAERPVGLRSSERLAESGPEGRAARSGNRSQEKRDESLLTGLFGSIASAAGGLEGLAEQALRDSNPITRRLAFSRLLEALTPENGKAYFRRDPDGALAWLESSGLSAEARQQIVNSNNRR